MILLTVYIDKVTRRDRQQKLMTSQLSIDLYTLPVALCFASVFCICVSASKMAATDSYFWFFVYYSVHKHSLKPRPTQHNYTMEELYITRVPGKISTERLRLTLRERTMWSVSKCFVPFSRHVKVLKLTLHINHNKYLSLRGTKAYLKL